MFPDTLTVLAAGAYPTKETVIVADPAGRESEYMPSAFVCVPRPPPVVTDAPEITFPELSETLPLTVPWAKITVEDIIAISKITVLILIAEFINVGFGLKYDNINIIINSSSR
jgi:hypothetical protein